MADLRGIAAAAARRYGIDPQIFLRQIQQESGFQPHVVSRAGARGIAQFMPATARSAGINPDNPVQALNAAARMDAANLHKYGNWRDTLSLYNSGRGWQQGRQIGETRNYVSSILGGSVPSRRAPTVLSPGGGASAPSAVPDTSGLRQALAANLIAASQASTAGQTPDYSQTFQLVSALRRGGTPAVGSSAVPAGVTAAGPGTPPGSPGLARFDGKMVAGWIAPILREARRAGWKGTVASGYRSYGQQARIYKSGVRPAARPGTSNHEFTAFPGGAVDVTNAVQLNSVLRQLGITKLQWAGGRDPVHFSHPHGGSY